MMQNNFYGYPVLEAHFGPSMHWQKLAVDVRGVTAIIHNNTHISIGYSVTSEMSPSVFAGTTERLVKALNCIGMWKYLKDLGHDPSVVVESGDLYRFSIDGCQYITDEVGRWTTSDDGVGNKRLEDIPVRDSNGLTWTRSSGKLVAITSRGETAYIFVRDEETGESFVLLGGESSGEVVKFDDESEIKEFLEKIS
jgi:hypothetical protein